VSAENLLSTPGTFYNVLFIVTAVWPMYSRPCCDGEQLITSAYRIYGIFVVLYTV